MSSKQYFCHIFADIDDKNRYYQNDEKAEKDVQIKILFDRKITNIRGQGLSTIK